MSDPYAWIDPFEDREAERANVRRRAYEEGYRVGHHTGVITRLDHIATRARVAADIRQYKSELFFSKGDLVHQMVSVAMDACAIIAERAPRSDPQPGTRPLPIGHEGPRQ